jgi:hypothetical protein
MAVEDRGLTRGGEGEEDIFPGSSAFVKVVFLLRSEEILEGNV